MNQFGGGSRVEQYGYSHNSGRTESTFHFCPGNHHIGNQYQMPRPAEQLRSTRPVHFTSGPAGMEMFVQHQSTHALAVDTTQAVHNQGTCVQRERSPPTGRDITQSGCHQLPPLGQLISDTAGRYNRPVSSPQATTALSSSDVNPARYEYGMYIAQQSLSTLPTSDVNEPTYRDGRSMAQQSRILQSLRT